MVALLHPEDMFSSFAPILCFWHAPCFFSMMVPEPWRAREDVFAIRSPKHITQQSLWSSISESLFWSFPAAKGEFHPVRPDPKLAPVGEENGNNKYLKVMPVTKSQLLLLGRDWLLWKRHIHSFYSNHTLVMCVPSYTRDHSLETRDLNPWYKCYNRPMPCFLSKHENHTKYDVCLPLVKLVHGFLLMTVGPSGGKATLLL